MKKFIKELKEFALKGNIIDLAVAVIIGGAFSLIIKSLVDDILMPLIGILIGGVGVSKLTITVGSAVIKYGVFIQAVINFVIIAISLFIVIKAFNAVIEKIRKNEEEQIKGEKDAQDTKDDEMKNLITEIRDLLKDKKN